MDVRGHMTPQGHYSLAFAILTCINHHSCCGCGDMLVQICCCQYMIADSIMQLASSIIEKASCIIM